MGLETDSQCGGRGFDPLPLHHITPSNTALCKRYYFLFLPCTARLRGKLRVWPFDSPSLFEGVANRVKTRRQKMGLEIQRKKDGALRSKWWYGRFTVNGKSSVVNLGVEIKGRVPESLKHRGDNPFEHSRMKAQVKLEELIAEANNHKTAEHHLEKLYELKGGSELTQVPISEISARWTALPARKKRTEQWEKTQCARLANFSNYILANYPTAKYISQITPKMAREWLQSIETHYAAATYNELRNLLKSFFERIGHDAGVVKNP